MMWVIYVFTPFYISNAYFKLVWSGTEKNIYLFYILFMKKYTKRRQTKRRQTKRRQTKKTKKTKKTQKTKNPKKLKTQKN